MLRHSRSYTLRLPRASLRSVQFLIFGRAVSCCVALNYEIRRLMLDQFVLPYLFRLPKIFNTNPDQSRSLWLLGVMRQVAGTGAAGIFISILSIIAQVTRLEDRPLLFGLFGAVFAISSVSLFTLSPFHFLQKIVCAGKWTLIPRQTLGPGCSRHLFAQTDLGFQLFVPCRACVAARSAWLK